MSYGYVYVAQISMGADMNQTIKAIAEAEAYPGPSLIIAYAPCINHGIKKGMAKAQTEEKLAVQSGYWTSSDSTRRLRARSSALTASRLPLTTRSSSRVRFVTHPSHLRTRQELRSCLLRQSRMLRISTLTLRS